ncbi:MAG: SH3 domain-containing protein [Chloroflexota bacterium]
MKLAKGKIIAIILMGLTLAFISISAAYASIGTPYSPIAQTVPTRTPIPQPTEPQPTKKPQQNNNDNNNNQPQPTAVPTETPYVPPTLVSDVVQLDRCGDPFFVAAFGGVNVRSIPSTDGEIVGKMLFLDTRQVLARTANDTWWQILLPDTTTGWVFDGAGEMIGSMESVPVVNADGSPVQEVSWQPTPDAFCPTMTPSPTPTSTATPVPTSTPTPEPSPTATVESVPTQPAVSAKPSQSDDDGSGSNVEAAADRQDDIISSLPDTQEIAEISTDIEPIQSEAIDQLELPNSTDSSSQVVGSGRFNWPILAGIALIIFGSIALFIQRRQDPTTS